MTLYSLDTVISVGYRVKSKQGTQFRIWATQTLRDHLLRGYTLHEKRLREKGFTEIEQAVELLSRTLANQSLVTEQGRAVLDVVNKYTRLAFAVGVRRRSTRHIAYARYRTDSIIDARRSTHSSYNLKPR